MNNAPLVTLTRAAEALAVHGITRNQLVNVYRRRERLGCAHAFSSLATRGWVRINLPVIKQFLTERGLIVEQPKKSKQN